MRLYGQCCTMTFLSVDTMPIRNIQRRIIQCISPYAMAFCVFIAVWCRKIQRAAVCLMVFAVNGGSSLQDDGRDTPVSSCQRACALWTPKAAHSALRFSRAKGARQESMKAEKAKFGAGLSQARQWLTLRVSAEEKRRVEEQAALAGLSVSEYMRRTGFSGAGGGRPIVAAADEAMLRELRRVGGLLKHHFVTAQSVGSGEELSEALRVLTRTIEHITTHFR